MDDVIISKHGKAIPVQKTVVVQAEKVMKQGEVGCYSLNALRT